MNKPNIFALATKELSQDSFFTWLIQWADNGYSQQDQALNETAKDLVRLFLGQDSNFNIHKVEAGRQWQNIDIWIKVNDKYFIGVEDKTNTGEHSQQLERYKETAVNHYGKSYELVFVYLKTGNESLSTLQEIRQKDYLVVDRKTILQVLNKQPVKNDIFNDFKDYLTEVEEQSNLHEKLEYITSIGRAGEGFYCKLQENIAPEWTDWRYVANRTGGFLGFWYYWRRLDGIGDIYIQIENAFQYGIKLVIKIGNWERSTHTLYRVLDELKPIAERNDLIISKPNKYRTGGTSTLAIVENAFQSDISGNFDYNGFLKTLKQLEKTLDEYSNDKNGCNRGFSK